MVNWSGEIFSMNLPLLVFLSFLLVSHIHAFYGCRSESKIYLTILAVVVILFWSLVYFAGIFTLL